MILILRNLLRKNISNLGGPLTTHVDIQSFNALGASHIQGDQKVSVHLMITVQNTQKYFKQFQSLTMTTYLELGVTDGVRVSLVSPGPGGRLPSSQIEPSSEARKTCVVIIVCAENF
jgi:hypothetical protein